MRGWSQIFYLYLIFSKTKAHKWFDTSSYFVVKIHQQLPFFLFSLFVKEDYFILLFMYQVIPKDLSSLLLCTALPLKELAVYLFCLACLSFFIWFAFGVKSLHDLDISLWITFNVRDPQFQIHYYSFTDHNEFIW